MKRVWGIAAVCVPALMIAGMSVADNVILRARQVDGFVEDVYYWQDNQIMNTEGTVMPNYNKRVKEIIFLEDSVSAQHPDTVRAVIKR